MSAWNVEGQGSDFNTEVAQIILNLFNQTNWTESMVGFSNITFGMQNWNDYGDYLVSILPISSQAEGDVLGSTSYVFDDVLAIHIFARNPTQNAYPATQIQAIKSQIEKILAINRSNAGQGIRYLGMAQWGYPRVDAQNSNQTLWHVVGTIPVFYRKTLS